MKLRRALPFLIPVACAASVLACGSRTGLLVPDDGDNSGEDVFVPADAFGGADAPDAEVEDALPPIDVTRAPPDAPNPCPDAGSTLIYVITEQNTLMSFYPPTGTFTAIGNIDCPVTITPLGVPTPFSMAVNESGIAYVVFNDGEVFRVSTANASCRPTGFVMEQGFPSQFGMGFSRDPNLLTETLYVAGDPSDLQDASVSLPAVLGTLDLSTFEVQSLGLFRPSIYGPELTGTGAGDLFAFYGVNQDNENEGPTAIGQIDKASGQVVAESPLPGVVQGSGWAFGFWGGDFYLFTAPGPVSKVNNPSIVTRFRPADNSIVQVAKTTETIVGAGVSTCAPGQ